MSSLHDGSIISGKYRLEQMLAKGGMGAVWIARHLQLDVNVALKLMAPEYAESAEARARFEREAKASAQLKVSNVAQVYDYGVEGDSPYIVMELLEGEDLAARLAREGCISPSAMLPIVQQICKALRSAHDVGLVHRDLKPANIFIARQAGDEVVKVLDFGIAKAAGPVLAGPTTKTGTLLGSPYYMSPEQVRRSKQLDHRSDLWSLGVIIFQCLTGRLPFVGEELGDVLMAICSDPIPAPSEVAPGLGPWADQLVSRALARDPAQRFQSADELASAFAALVRADASKPAALAITVPASPMLSQSTMAPAGRSVNPPSLHAQRASIVVASLVGLILLAAAAFTLLRTTAAARQAAAPPPLGASAEPPSAPPSSPPEALSSSTPLAPSAAPTSAPVGPSANPVPSAAPSAPRQGATSSAPPAVPRKPTRKPNDPLNQM